MSTQAVAKAGGSPSATAGTSAASAAGGISVSTS
eukprot:CAMPEP_0177492802 /NCGR_PEP_ID=MMETSP0369-20130122/32553_1 /TAXON_ID=447022 ORGANISM="Scrippsiella hangoei-like, Strain SHHI-4" /NCGR_SAMPLE_ID=MMETSP0369 /ASSEMBLY_ACC=CAM_ASM_000364 /LENGTH=33 /DNA_ID= /DNA_START= /DNA_END= /DNA_ORIENTATION=